MAIASQGQHPHRRHPPPRHARPRRRRDRPRRRRGTPRRGRRRFIVSQSDVDAGLRDFASGPATSAAQRRPSRRPPDRLRHRRHRPRASPRRSLNLHASTRTSVDRRASEPHDRPAARRRRPGLRRSTGSTRPRRLDARRADGAHRPLAFQITYAPLANGTDVRIIVDRLRLCQDHGRAAPITRTIMQDFRIVKRVNHAIVSNSRIMIGKNVHIVGDLGARFDRRRAHQRRPRSSCNLTSTGSTTTLDDQARGLLRRPSTTTTSTATTASASATRSRGTGIPADTTTDGDGRARRRLRRRHRRRVRRRVRHLHQPLRRQQGRAGSSCPPRSAGHALRRLESPSSSARRAAVDDDLALPHRLQQPRPQPQRRLRLRSTSTATDGGTRTASHSLDYDDGSQHRLPRPGARLPRRRS
jgi:hypothetical protein